MRSKMFGKDIKNGDYIVTIVTKKGNKYGSSSLLDDKMYDTECSIRYCEDIFYEFLTVYD